jgi:hypothetical protein
MYFCVALCIFCAALCIFCVSLCIFLCCSMYFLCRYMYLLCCSTYCLFCDVPCIVCVYMCTEQLPPGGYPTAVKYIISFTKNMGRGFLHHPTFPTQRAVLQSQEVKMTPQGVMTNKQANYCPGLSPIKGHNFSPGS